MNDALLRSRSHGMCTLKIHICTWSTCFPGLLASFSFVATNRECSVSPILSTRPVTTAESLSAAALLKSLNLRDDDPELTTRRLEPITALAYSYLINSSVVQHFSSPKNNWTPSTIDVFPLHGWGLARTLELWHYFKFYVLANQET